MKASKLFFALICIYSLILVSSCKKDSETPKPVITGFSPSSGVVGATVTITGSNFSANPIDNIVTFNGELATVSVSSVSEIITTIPAGSTTGPIAVAVNGQVATGDEDFTVLEALSYSNDAGWSCETGIDCQDLYKFQFIKGTAVSITVDNVSSGSIARIALYAPGVATGGVNLLTDDLSTKDLLCSSIDGCSSLSTESFSNFNITESGVYTVAVTRNWGSSCDSDGTYKLLVNSTMGLTFLSSTNDTASGATGYQCP